MRPMPFAIALVVLGMLGLPVAAQQYDVIDLGPLPAGVSTDVAQGINSSGTIVGYLSRPDFTFEAMSWTESGGFEFHGFLGGDKSLANAINDAGVVVGRSDTGVGIQTRPFRLLPGGMLESLGTLGGTTGAAEDVNAAGVITGSAATGMTTHAFVWTEGGGMVDIGNFVVSGFSAGTGINAAGRVSGRGTTAAGDTHAFLWDGVSFTDLMTIASGTQSYGEAINDADTVVGFGSLDPFASTFGAFRWTPTGGIVQLDQLFPYETRAFDVNNADQAVGWSWVDGMGNSRAVLWEGAGPIVNLNDRIDAGSGWLLESATSINDEGQIVGVGRLNGAARAFMLTPQVPEPVGRLLTASGLLGAALQQRRYARRGSRWSR